jgi:uncharacterized protein
MSPPLIDVNVNLSRWPFRRLPLDETPALVKKLRANHVQQAWAGSFDSILHKDVAGVNARLAQECREHGHGILIPFGAINPMQPDWEEDLRRCHEEYKMPGIRIYPNYHGYKLTDPIFSKLLRAATERHLVVQLAVLMEDRRTQHPLIPMPPVDFSPLVSIASQFEGLRLVLLNSFQNNSRDLVANLAATGKVYFEIATLEGAGGIENLLHRIPVRCLLFGSHAPFFYFESALLKLKESELDEATLRAISNENARQLLAKK